MSNDGSSMKDPYAGLHAEAIYAMWHDPLTYDPIKHGPPYLPELKVKTASQKREWKAACDVRSAAWKV